jgi:nitrogen fixation protein FixH
MRNSPWRWFPLALMAGLGAVMLVNAGMVFAALKSFPGKAGSEDFELSNRYDTVLQRSERDAALGWTVQASTDKAGLPVVVLTRRDGAPLQGALLEGVAGRPLGPAETQHLTFHESAVGRYVADAALPEQGQWELTLSASDGGSQIAATRRVIVH